MTSHTRSLKSSVARIANLLGRYILATPLWIIGVLMLVIAFYCGSITIIGVFILLGAPWCVPHVGLWEWLGAGGAMVVFAVFCAGFTWGGKKVLKAANKALYEYPGDDRINTESAASDSLLRASSQPAAKARSELLRPSVEKETPGEQLLRGSVLTERERIACKPDDGVELAVRNEYGSKMSKNRTVWAFVAMVVLSAFSAVMSIGGGLFFFLSIGIPPVVAGLAGRRAFAFGALTAATYWISTQIVVYGFLGGPEYGNNLGFSILLLAYMLAVAMAACTPVYFQQKLANRAQIVDR